MATVTAARIRCCSWDFHQGTNPDSGMPPNDQEQPPLGVGMKEVLLQGLHAGTSGAMAMTVQVTTLMWLRTTMNYQYRHGTTTSLAMSTLYKQGGIWRFYQGIGPALIQGPVSRFGDTGANVAVLAALEQYELPLSVKTAVASLAAGLWRIAIMPIDATKTTLQVEGRNGLALLRAKIHASGPAVLWHGSLAAASATVAGHFPWFFTFNYLQQAIPTSNDTLTRLARNAIIGFLASVVSDTTSNSLRVIKTSRQTFPHVISYTAVVRHVLREDGVAGLLGRGLKTRILANGLQGMLFSVLWRFFMQDKSGRRDG